MAPPLRPWADLHVDLFFPIVDRLPSLRDYVSVHGVCAAWRSALPSVSPCLLVLDDLQPPVSRPVQRLGSPRFNTRAYALSIPMQRTLPLPTLRCHSSYVTGSTNGYLLILNGVDGRRPGPGLLNPLTGEQIELLPLPSDGHPLRLVLGPNPRSACYTAVAICLSYSLCDYVTKVAYVTNADTEWTIANVAVDGAKLVDLVYHAERGDIYCLDERGNIQVLHISRCGRMQTIEPLLVECGDVSLGFATFSAPYDAVSKKISFGRLFFCEGILYQVWQNIGVTKWFPLSAGGVFMVSPDEILVLRYYPVRCPCWDAVKDLGGYSVFIGKNNTTVLQAETAIGIGPNCVYLIDSFQCTPWVFDMSNRTSTRCVLPSSLGTPRCWYFSKD